jgi:anti-sigma factor RsiW
MILSDELLMAYADGELDAHERERIARELARDRRLAARLEVFLSTGHSVAPLFGGILRTPLPTGLERVALRTRPLPAATQAGPSLARRLRGFFAPVSPIRIAAVSAAVFVSVLGTTSLMLQGGASVDASPLNGLIQQAANGQPVAAGPLELALNSSPAGEETRARLADGQAARLAVKLTFPDRSHSYCRQYEIAAQKTYAGIACKLPLEGGNARWAIPYQVELASARRLPGRTTPSGIGGSGIEHTVVSMIGGDVLAAKDEQAAIAAGWKRH